MKKFVAPEMEISKFAMEDIITVSGGGTVIPPVTAGITTAADLQFKGFSADATYGEF